MSKKSKVFVEITNQQIYEQNKAQFIALDAKIDLLKDHVLETNGKVKRTWWAATTALTLTLVLLSLFLQYIVKH